MIGLMLVLRLIGAWDVTDVLVREAGRLGWALLQGPSLEQIGAVGAAMFVAHEVWGAVILAGREVRARVRRWWR